MRTWKECMDANDLEGATFYHDMHQMLGHTISQWDTRLRIIMKVDKQLKECAPNVRDIINTWMNEKIKEPAYANYMHALRHWFENPTLENYESVDPDRGVAFDFLIVYMDAYTVARAFRKFHQKQNEYNKDMRNIFIYTGGFHTENYINLLGRLGCFKDGEVVNPHPKYTQCIPVEQFTPWKLVDTNICE